MIQRFHRLWTTSWSGRIALFAVMLLFGVLGYNGAKLAYALFYWQAYIWAPSYWMSPGLKSTIPDSEKHLIFIMVDHYEHGVGEAAAERNLEWCRRFRKIADRNRDDYGNRFRYTWFYPYDHGNDAIMRELSLMAFEGYGEVEMHWHLTPACGATNENYGQMLRDAIAWYQQFGAMITVDIPGRTAFAYVAGNWDLDASRTPVSHGVTDQIQILFENGCYADFTFSTIGTASQPATVNSLYYVQTEPRTAKSYNRGIHARVDNPVDDKLLMFQGPSHISWNGRLEYGAVESSPRFRPERIPKWIDANVHVHGRPEWIFVKVYSHGAQSSAVVLDHDMEWMLQSLKEYCSARGMKLHYMTAREAFNVVKAAEAGMQGNPEEYRNFAISPYRNMVFDYSDIADMSTFQ